MCAQKGRPPHLCVQLSASFNLAETCKLDLFKFFVCKIGVSCSKSGGNLNDVLRDEVLLTLATGSRLIFVPPRALAATLTASVRVMAAMWLALSLCRWPPPRVSVESQVRT